MRRKVTIVVAALAMALGTALPAVAAGHSNGYGKAIQTCLGDTYGQAKNAAWESGHATKPALGAKATAIAHGC